MGGDQAKPGGPDLAAGVAFADLVDGKPLVGHAGDDAVLVVRQGQDVFAVGATCTHYGGPLGEGAINGATVRCPWHHACFSLRTGEAERAPALNPIPCYEVVRSGDRVRVGSKRPQREPALVSPGVGAVLIVGAGAAGHAAAEKLRREGHQGAIVLCGADTDAPYDRPNLSKDYLAGTAPEEWIPLRPPEFYAEHRIELHLGAGARVTSLDTGARTASLADGRKLSWNALLLATGAEAIPLAVPGAERAHVHTLRTLADSRAIIARAGSARRAVVIGASFIALEAAAALRARKIDVAVVAPDEIPFARVLGPEVGAFLRGVHEAHGVTFHLGQTVTSVGDKDVQLSGGARLDADLVLAGIGVRPAIALAESAGLAVDRGITVDERLQTSVPGVYAAGDAARYPDPISGQNVRIEHWVVAQRMGQTAARNILGQRQAFRSAPFFWSAHYDVTLSYVGHAERWDRIDIHGKLADRDCTIAYRDGERTLAVATLGRDMVSLAAETAFEKGDQVALRSFGRER